MGRKLENGTVAQVTILMAQYAIRDQQALIDAYTPMFGEPDDTAQEVIKKCKSLIGDFRRLETKARGTP